MWTATAAVDLITASDTVSVLRNLGDGTFAAPVTYALGDSPNSVTAADVDGDGAVDMVTTNYGSDTVSVLRNLGNGTFAAEMTYTVGDGPDSVTAADVDGDGAVDLVTAKPTPAPCRCCGTWATVLSRPR